MLKQDDLTQLSVPIRNAQIIVAALLLGVLGFIGVTFVVVPFDSWNQTWSMMVLVGLVVSLPAIVLSVILPRVTCNASAKESARKSADKKKLQDDRSLMMECANHFMTSTILRAAPLEGACFLNVILFFIDHSVISLGVAGALLLLMAAGFPTNGRAVDWIESQMERVRDFARSGS